MSSSRTSSRPWHGVPETDTGRETRACTGGRADIPSAVRGPLPGGYAAGAGDVRERKERRRSEDERHQYWIQGAAALRAALVLVFCLLVSGVGAGERFVPGFEALPLMAGLEIEPGSAMEFDKPDGRIVEAAAVGNLPEAQIRGWYEDVLPQLGWQSVGEGRFRREGEMLSLSVTRDGTGARVAFRLYPQ